MARLISVNVGLPRDVAWHGQTVHTGIWKQPVQGLRTVRKLNVDGDGQGDLAGHGGEQRAVMVYQMDSYRYWERFLGRSDFELGQFGENFTVEDGLADDEVCIGDRYRIGSALFEITQPRVTCYRVGIRMNDPQMPALLVSHRRPGFYFRVLEEGSVTVGDQISKVADGPERLTVAETDALLYLPARTPEALERALRIPALSAGWKGSFRALLNDQATGHATGNAGLTSLAAVAPPAWSGFRPLRVAAIQRESASVVSFWLESVNGSALPPPLPGQSLVVRLHTSPDAQPVLRNYSISSAPASSCYRISVKQEEKGLGSRFLHTGVHAGDILDIAAPRGAFTLQPGDAPVVLMSAGIGATPVLAMLHALAASRSERRIWWLYGARNAAEHPFAAEVATLVQSLPNCRSYVVYSQPGSAAKHGGDFDGTGHLDSALCETLHLPPEADYYLCGPQSFLTTLLSGLRERGLPSAQLHSEIFGGGESFTPGIAATARKQPHLPAGVPGTGPAVSFARSGITAPWDAKFNSLLEFAEACDVPVKWSCRSGVCHSCESALVGGSVSYRPEPLDLPAQGNVLLCCAQPGADVQLDL